ncbi:hypothetical protein ACEWY4_009381 [Coilia grayii]|uniref:NEDD4-binding protein 2-like 1 n=1 Tax=Coilia grayii TaxID=363190 RepID=A0ABD1K690_9TELE
MPTYRWRKLIILRGLPGTRKTDKANELIGPDGRGVIVSAFDYFRTGSNGEIVFNRRDLWRAHREALRKAEAAMRRGDHPIIICNINTELWMMYPYVFMGFRDFEYFIEFIDMEHPPIHELYWRCEGKVPFWLLRKWLRNYDHVHRGLRGIFKILNDETSITWWSGRDWFA